jgi:hypothetical protein
MLSVLPDDGSLYPGGITAALIRGSFAGDAFTGVGIERVGAFAAGLAVPDILGFAILISAHSATHATHSSTHSSTHSRRHHGGRHLLGG